MCSQSRLVGTVQKARKSTQSFPSDARQASILRIRQMALAARWDEDEMDISPLLTSRQLMNLRNA